MRKVEIFVLEGKIFRESNKNYYMTERARNNLGGPILFQHWLHAVALLNLGFSPLPKSTPRL